MGALNNGLMAPFAAEEYHPRTYDPRYDARIGESPQIAFSAINTGPGVTADQVSSNTQDWSGRYNADYNASLGAQNATAAQRSYMQDVAAGRAGQPSRIYN